MIYTHGLDQSVNHIMVYDGNTPVAVVKLSFYYNPDSINICDYNEEEWIMHVRYVLIAYATKYKLDDSKLSAKPVKITQEFDLHD